MSAITVRPNTAPLREYLEASRKLTPHDIAIAKAMRCVEREAIHTGPFNWSGKEIYRTDKPTEGN